MPLLLLSGSCEEDATVCAWVLEVSGDQQVATVADWLVGKPLALAGLALLGLVARWVLHRVIDRIVRGAETPMTAKGPGGALAQRLGSKFPDTTGGTRRVQRAQTIGSLLKSIVSGVVGVVVFTMMLSEIGANIGPILASAGIVGVALGFGAQSLVKDFLSGIFMIFEDQYGVGDVIDLGTTTGTVEGVTLRVTRVRDINGTVWYVRNGEILRVGNKSQNWARTVLDVYVPFGEDLTRVRHLLAEVADDLWRDEDHSGLIIEQPEVLGVQSFDAEGVAVRVTMRTAPAEQFRIGRELRERIITRFEAESIELFTTPRIATPEAE